MLYVLFFISDKANYKETLKVLNEMGINDPSLVDCANVRYICECVSRRSAHLVSAGLAVLLNKMDEKSVTIGVDGSVYRFHPYFHKLMVEKTKQLTNSDIKVSVTLLFYILSMYFDYLLLVSYGLLSKTSNLIKSINF